MWDSARNKQRVHSCHTAEVMSIQMFTCAPHVQGNNRSQPWVVGPPPRYVWCGRLAATDWTYCFRFPDFCRIMWDCGAQSINFWSENWRQCGFFVPQILRGQIWTPPYGDIGPNQFRNRHAYTASCRKFRENRPMLVQGPCVEKSVDRKRNITKLKYNSLPLSLKR